MTGFIKPALCSLLAAAILLSPSAAFSIEVTGKGGKKTEVNRIDQRSLSIRTQSDKELTTVRLSGRVVTPAGRPISNAKIILMDIDGPTQVTVSGGLGYYSISGIVPGRTYVLGVFHKRYIFASPTQTFEINTDQNNIILLGEENW
jgi:hypothetical protein